MKTTKKTNKKNVKPAYVVDMTNCNTAFDLRVKFAEAKQSAGLPINDSDLEALLENEVLKFAGYINDKCAICACNSIIVVGDTPKRKPWYKRFWNWLRRK